MTNVNFYPKMYLETLRKFVNGLEEILMNKLTDQINEFMLVLFQTVQTFLHALRNNLYTGNPIILKHFTNSR